MEQAAGGAFARVSRAELASTPRRLSFATVGFDQLLSPLESSANFPEWIGGGAFGRASEATPWAPSIHPSARDDSGRDLDELSSQRDELSARDDLAANAVRGSSA